MRVMALRGASAAAMARVRELLAQAVADWLRGWSVQPLRPEVRVQPATTAQPTGPGAVGGGLELPDGRGLEWSCTDPESWLAALLDLPRAVFAAAPWQGEIGTAAWADLGAALCAAFELPAEHYGAEHARTGVQWTDPRTAALGGVVEVNGSLLSVRFSAALVERLAPRPARRTRQVRLQPRTALLAGRELALEARLQLAGVSLKRLRDLRVGDILMSGHRLDEPLPLRIANRAAAIHALVCADTGRRALQIHQLEEQLHGSFAH